MVKESPAEEITFPYSERHLQCVWYDQRLRPGVLYSNNGKEIVIEDPGRWNLESGPDFLDAVLVVGPARKKIKGDVEIHVHPVDWIRHGHAQNPGYTHVIAHVTYFSGNVPEDILPKGTVQISLKDAMKAASGFSFESIDVAAYPYAKPETKELPCFRIINSWLLEERIALLESAGEERLRTKAERIKQGIQEKGPDQLLYEEIMCSLGYKRNRQSFRRLANIVTLESIQKESKDDVIKTYSLLLGVAGLLPTGTSSRWDNETRSFVRNLWDHWWKLQSKWESQRLPSGTWVLSGLRPQNHPRRRLAAAAAIFTRKTSLSTQLTALSTSDPKAWFYYAEALLQNNNEIIDYWKYHLSFSGKRQSFETVLLGSRRIAAILSNVIVPFVSASGIFVKPLLALLPPEEDNSLVRQTAFSLFGCDHNPALYRNGLRQQGLLQIFHDFCLNNKTDCKKCRLVNTLNESNERLR
ncbi:DUF2851 family protein [Verrucomicrobiota bacterium]